MKQSVVAALLLAGLLVPNAGNAQQGYQCYLVCNPPRLICVPAGSSLPPYNRICLYGPQSAAQEDLSQPALAAPSQSTAAGSACSAQSVFNEDTQTYEWEMACD